MVLLLVIIFSHDCRLRSFPKAFSLRLKGLCQCLKRNASLSIANDENNLLPNGAIDVLNRPRRRPVFFSVEGMQMSEMDTAALAWPRNGSSSRVDQSLVLFWDIIFCSFLTWQKMKFHEAWTWWVARFWAVWSTRVSTQFSTKKFLYTL